MSMTGNKIVTGLVVFNVLLLGLFASRYIKTNEAKAQARRPGDYLMIPVLPSPGQQAVMCVVDMTSGEYSAIALDEGTKKLVAQPRMKLSDILDPNSAGTNRRGR